MKSKNLTLQSMLDVIQAVANDRELNFHGKEKNGRVFVNLASKQPNLGHPVRTAHIGIREVKEFEQRENALMKLFGTKKTWDPRIQKLLEGEVYFRSEEIEGKKKNSGLEIKQESPIIDAKAEEPMFAEQPAATTDVAIVGNLIPQKEASIATTRLTFASWVTQIDAQYPQPAFKPPEGYDPTPASDLVEGYPMTEIVEDAELADPELAESAPNALSALEEPAENANILQQSGDFAQRLKNSGVMGNNEDLPLVAERISHLLSLRARNDGSDESQYITPQKILWFLQRPKGTHKSGTMLMGINYYRIWQAVDEVSTKTGKQRYNVDQFWELDRDLSANPLHQLGYRLYRQRIIPLLDRPANRHIQSIEHLADKMGLGSSAFSFLIARLELAYRPANNKSPVELKLNDLSGANTIEPSEELAALADVLGCDTKEIVPYEDWLEAVQAAPEESFKKMKRSTSRKRLLGSSLSTQSAAVMDRLRTSGITDPQDIVNALNKRIKDAGIPLYHRLGVDMTYVSACIVRCKPFGPDNAGYESLPYHRITEIVNERRLGRGLYGFSTEELFGVKRRDAPSTRRKLEAQAHSHLLDVLDRPENRIYHSINRLAVALKGKTEDVESLFENLTDAYTLADDQEIKPHPILTNTATFLGCNAEDIIPHALWKEAVDEEPAASLDKGAISDELDAGGDDFPESFINVAREAVAKRELAAQRRGIIMSLANATYAAIEKNRKTLGVIGEIVSPSEVAADLLETPIVSVEDNIPFSKPVIASVPGEKEELSAHQEEGLVIEPQRLLPKHYLPAIMEPAPEEIPAGIVSQDQKTEIIKGDFDLAALEVLRAYRELNQPQTAVEFSLLNAVEGLNFKNQKTSLAEVAASIGFDSPEEIYDIVGETKEKLIKVVHEKTGRLFSQESIIDALRLYHKQVTGRTIINKWIELGALTDGDDTVGRALPRPIAANAVKEIRTNLLQHLGQVLQDVSPV